jgi:hypothetical protein
VDRLAISRQEAKRCLAAVIDSVKSEVKCVYKTVLDVLCKGDYSLFCGISSSPPKWKRMLFL